MTLHHGDAYEAAAVPVTDAGDRGTVADDLGDDPGRPQV